MNEEDTYQFDERELLEAIAKGLTMLLVTVAGIMHDTPVSSVLEKAATDLGTALYGAQYAEAEARAMAFLNKMKEEQISFEFDFDDDDTPEEPGSGGMVN